MIETRCGSTTNLIRFPLVVVPLVAIAIDTELSRPYMQVNVATATPVPPNESIHVLIRLAICWYIILGSKLRWCLWSQAKDEVAARNIVVARALADYGLALVARILAACGHVPRAHSLQREPGKAVQRITNELSLAWFPLTVG